MGWPRSTWGLLVLAAAVGGLAAPAGAAVVHRDGRHSYAVTVRGAARANLSVTRLTFPVSGRRALPAEELRVRLRAPAVVPGVYVTVGRLFPSRRATVSALAVIVNRRPAAALHPDRAAYTLEVSGARLTTAPRVGEIANAFVGRGILRVRPPAAICADHAGPLAATAVQPVLGAGARFGFGAATVLAQGYDAACLRPVSPAFRRAVTAHDPCPPPPPCGPLPKADRPICPQPDALIPCPLDGSPR